MSLSGYQLRNPIVRRNVGEIQVAITPAGREEAQNYTSGGPIFDVLSTLNERSPLNLRVLSRDTNLDMSKVKGALRFLIKNKFAMVVQSDTHTGMAEE